MSIVMPLDFVIYGQKKNPRLYLRPEVAEWVVAAQAHVEWLENEVSEMDARIKSLEDRVAAALATLEAQAKSE
jgi:hypothetical protein